MVVTLRELYLMANGLGKASLKDGTVPYTKEISSMVCRKVMVQRGTQIMTMPILLILKVMLEMKMMKSLTNEDN